MKKYLVIIGTFIVLLIIFVQTECLDRIKILYKGLSGYEEKDYDYSLTEIKIPSISIDMKNYTGKEIVLYNTDGVKLSIRDIIYRGDEYRFVFCCEGKGRFREGQILFLDNARIQRNDSGDYLELIGVDSREKSSQNYVFIMPLSEEPNNANILLYLDFYDVYLKQYERK